MIPIRWFIFSFTKNQLGGIRIKTYYPFRYCIACILNKWSRITVSDAFTIGNMIESRYDIEFSNTQSDKLHNSTLTDYFVAEGNMLVRGPEFSKWFEVDTKIKEFVDNYPLTLN